MPIYTYKCQKCENKYEVFHKTREDESNIFCPECNSTDYRKIMSAASIGSSTSNGNMPACNAFAGGSCPGGACGLN